LFPEEHSSNGKQVLVVEKLRRWEEEGFSMMKFVEGWWTDSDEDSSEDDYEDEDEDEDEFDENDLDGEDNENHSDEDESLEKNNDQALDTPNGTLEPFASLPGALKELMGQLMPDFVQKEGEEPDMKEEFMEFLDREKARGTMTRLINCVTMKLTNP